MGSSITSPAAAPTEVEDASKLGGGARAVIWLLVTLLYGGGLVVWFGGIHFLKPYAQAFNSHDRSYDYSSNYAPAADDAEAYTDGDAEVVPPEYETLTRDEGSKWPALQVTGVMQRDGNQLAMLDSEVLPVGASYKEVTIVAIESKRVFLKFKNEGMWVLIGGFTN